MEKCTFCVQRIRRAEQEALAQGQPLKDGMVVPACVQTCPTDALVFGDLYDPESGVARLLENNPRQFRFLEHFGTEPSVYYLKGGSSRV
jgi:molybdopterin-containing oxidoreductase family iron-sulfur binding subunit